MIDIYGWIRIHNWIENDVGYGHQIELNNDDGLYDMMDNFDWDEILIEEFKEKSPIEPFIYCTFDKIEGLSEEETKDICEITLENYGTPCGELQEIIDELILTGDII